MNYVDIPAGEVVFVDANPLVDHFSANPATGPASQALLQRIVQQEIVGVTAAHVMAEMAHRLMTIEACALFGWPYKGIAQRLANHPAEVRKLTAFRAAIDDVSAIGMQIHAVLPHYLATAADVILQHGLLYNDALVVAVMQARGIGNLASNDRDFDRVSGIARFSAT